MNAEINVTITVEDKTMTNVLKERTQEEYYV